MEAVMVKLGSLPKQLPEETEQKLRNHVMIAHIPVEIQVEHIPNSITTTLISFVFTYLLAAIS
jgi:hypothetical protein